MKNRLRETWARDDGAVNGWLSIPNSFTAEIMSRADFDSLTIDLQHGLNDYSDALTLLSAIRAADATPLARVPWNEPGIIMKLLDAGCLGIICPMVNTAEDAARFVGATRYSPAGYRSSGPTRAALVHDGDYFAEANDQIVSFAMVETVEAVSNVEAIAATPGLTGIYVGPSDLSITMGFGPGLDRTEPEMEAALARILAACRANGIIAGLHCEKPAYIKKMFAQGYRFASLASDVRFFTSAVAANIAGVRS